MDVLVPFITDQFLVKVYLYLSGWMTCGIYEWI